jgi:hypothetical protein
MIFYLLKLAIQTLVNFLYKKNHAINKIDKFVVKTRKNI